MKKFLLLLSVFALIVTASVLFTACNGDEAENNDDSAGAVNTISVTEDSDSETKEKESDETTAPQDSNNDSGTTDRDVDWSKNY